METQIEVFPGEGKIPRFPTTRYQGSKSKLLTWIWECIKNLKFNSALDAFGGTSSVAYLLKTKGKKVIYNDSLRFNYYIGLALIENNKTILSDTDIDYLLKEHEEIKYPSFITETFRNIYYTDTENKWLDRILTNIDHLENKYKKALAYFALFQSCIIKRPFNLFHRKNLYIRTAEVKRSFGNKATWDKPFEFYFRKFAEEVNNAVLNNNQANKAYNKDIFDLQEKVDLVYIDTPYINSKGAGVDYLEFYHFLEGLTDYENWRKKIDWNTQNLRFKKGYSIWLDEEQIKQGFDRLFDKFKNSILVVSYRSDGIPSIEELLELLHKYKERVSKANHIKYKYVLSKSESKESLLIAE